MRNLTRLNRLAVLGAMCLGSLLAMAGCGGEEVTAESIGKAKRLWEQAKIRDYDLEWMSSGLSQARYRVTVRDGSVRSIEAVLPDGRTYPVHPAEPKFYGVEGLFMIMSDELAQRKSNAPFGQPKGTKSVLRFTPDPKLGYPRSYRRDVLGAPMSLAIDVVRLVPEPPTRR
jgi:hypothetical protein